ncbi:MULTISPECIES: hypothetical protein [Mammaliicoccus]|nr:MULTISPECIES: hypothetical protein [Mammaliicoccus]MBO3063088.1 hypothetical protein [Mammaliicoccus fleurettii]
MFVATLHTGGSWEELTQTQSDTGWIPFLLINVAESNTEYNGETSKGFD